MKLFVQSCHASLEFDQARCFLDYGFEVFGNWDIGSIQRPKIAGVTDVNSDIKDFDLIILHQVPEYPTVMKELLMQGKRVVLISFGQADTWQYEAVGQLCRDYPHAYVAAYSQKDYRLHRDHGASDKKVRLIRFAKYREDYHEWQGTNRYAYSSCNDIHNRGEGCGWDKLKEVASQCPLVLSGKRTDDVGGFGEIPETVMRRQLQYAACFASFGTKPAPWVMTQMEAWMAGCPVVVLDNGCGLREESLPIMIEDSTSAMAAQINRLIADEGYRRAKHEDSLEIAKVFDAWVIGPMWVEFLKEVAE